MKKLNFANVKDVLSRDEMKNVMAGSGSGCGKCTVPGYTSVSCYSSNGGTPGCPCLCLYRGAGCGC